MCELVAEYEIQSTRVPVEHDGHALLHIRQPRIASTSGACTSSRLKKPDRKMAAPTGLPVCAGRFSQLMQPWLVTQRPAQRGPGRKLKQAQGGEALSSPDPCCQLNAGRAVGWTGLDGIDFWRET